MIEDTAAGKYEEEVLMRLDDVVVSPDRLQEYFNTHSYGELTVHFYGVYMHHHPVWTPSVPLPWSNCCYDWNTWHGFETSTLGTLEARCKEFLQLNALGMKAHLTRANLIRSELTAIFGAALSIDDSAFEFESLALFGSSANGLSISTESVDVDLALEVKFTSTNAIEPAVQAMFEAENVFALISKAITASGTVFRVVGTVLLTTVPILKLEHIESSTQVCNLYEKLKE